MAGLPFRSSHFITTLPWNLGLVIQSRDIWFSPPTLGYPWTLVDWVPMEWCLFILASVEVTTPSNLARLLIPNPRYSEVVLLVPSVRNIHKYPLFILGIYTNYSFMFLLSSYLRLLFLVNSVLCLEWYSWNVTIYLHKLVKGNLVKRATEHLTPAEFQYTSALGSALLKHLQAATITLRPRPRPSGIQK